MKLIWFAILAAFGFGLMGCTQSSFTGTARKSSDVNRQVPPGEDGVDAADADDAVDNGDADDLDDNSDIGGDADSDGDSDAGGDEDDNDVDLDTDGDEDEDDEPDLDLEEDDQWLAKKCDAVNGKVVFSGQQCPAHHAAFSSDDGSSTRVGCCPLPSRSILDASHTPEARGSCAANEIAVGASGEGFFCQRINESKFQLTQAQKVCYWGDGAAGNDGASDCNNIIAELQGLIGLTGDQDGCVAQPYGAVMQRKSGKDCGDQQSVVIVDKATGNPIKMFP